MNPLREAAQQALEALELGYDSVKAEAARYHTAMAGFRPQRHAALDAEVEQLAAAITALRAALAQEQAEPDISRCPKCNGPADNGFDRSIPPNPYLCTKCMAEPVQAPGAWVASKDGRVIYDDTSADDGLLRVSGDFENDEQRLRYAQRIADALNAALSKAEPVPLTEEDIRKYADKHLRYQPESYEASGVFDLVHAVEKASWEKNHG